MILDVKEKKNWGMDRVYCLGFTLMFCFSYTRTIGKSHCLLLLPYFLFLQCSVPRCQAVTLLNHKNVVSILNTTEFSPKMAFCGTFHHCPYPVGRWIFLDAKKTGVLAWFCPLRKWNSIFASHWIIGFLGKGIAFVFKSHLFQMVLRRVSKNIVYLILLGRYESNIIQ